MKWAVVSVVSVVCMSCGPKVVSSTPIGEPRLGHVGRHCQAAEMCRQWTIVTVGKVPVTASRMVHCRGKAVDRVKLITHEVEYADGGVEFVSVVVEVLERGECKVDDRRWRG